jgi:hypothetical protein
LIESVIDGPAPLNIHENRKPELAANRTLRGLRDYFRIGSNGPSPGPNH